jgi:uncharacterized membrane protein
MHDEQKTVWPSSSILRPTALVGVSGLGAVLFLVRWRFTGFPGFLFLGWNLFLAWVPWALSVMAARVRTGIFFWALFAAWLAFWPNAPYLLTDLVHLRARPPVPLWLDVMLLSTFAWAGCLVGWDSLAKVHVALRGRLGWPLADGAVVSCVGLCGIGVFLGRFERLNSWELLTAPGEVLASCRESLLQPRAVAFSLAFALLVGAGYLFTLPRLNGQRFVR